MPVALEYYSDHFVIRMVGSSALSALRRAVVIPYSDITSVEVGAPEWPHVLKEWRIGTHMPGIIASGTFGSWKGGPRRFLHFDHKDEKVLTLKLSSHPDFQEVSVAVKDAEAARDELQKRVGSA